MNKYLKMQTYSQAGNALSIKNLPLAQVLEKYVFDTPIDFMTIDTEGSEEDVLESNDWNKYRPKLIIVETLEYNIN